jgi:hypothetical protein
VNATCGTDRATLERRALHLRRCGFGHVNVVEHAYENEVDLTYIAGHLRSAMSESALPPDRERRFRVALNDALRPQLEAGPLIERIEATALIAIPDAAPRSTSAGCPPRSHPTGDRPAEH